MLTVFIVRRITTGYIDLPTTDDISLDHVELNEHKEL